LSNRWTASLSGILGVFFVAAAHAAPLASPYQYTALPGSDGLAFQPLVIDDQRRVGGVYTNGWQTPTLAVIQPDGVRWQLPSFSINEVYWAQYGGPGSGVLITDTKYVIPHGMSSTGLLVGEQHDISVANAFVSGVSNIYRGFAANNPIPSYTPFWWDPLHFGGKGVAWTGVSRDGQLLLGVEGVSPWPVSWGLVYNTSSGQVTALDGVNDYSSKHLTLSVNGANSLGRVVGTEMLYAASGNHVAGFTFDLNTGIRQEVELAGYANTALVDVDNLGRLLGNLSGGPSTGIPIGFIGTPDRYTLIAFPGAEATVVSGMDPAGDVIGTYQDSTGSWQGFMAVPVPEPASSALASIGLLLILVWRHPAASDRRNPVLVNSHC
jgi:hypothetical protein